MDTNHGVDHEIDAAGADLDDEADLADGVDREEDQDLHGLWPRDEDHLIDVDHQ